MLENLNLIPFELRHYVFRWEGILILVGSIILITDPRRNAGWILILIGGFFLLPDIVYIPWFKFRTFWPLLLIILGILYIIRQRSYHTYYHADSDAENDTNSPSGEGTGVDYLNDTNVFGGGDVTVTSQNFKGGKITSIFGGSNYYLEGAKLSEGKAVIDFFAMFGGGTFVVPADWNVKSDVVAIFGGFSDKRRLSADKATDTSKELLIKGFVLFGGGEIKSV